MALCGEKNVTLSFLSENGRFLARVQGPVSGNVLLRREQYRRADIETSSTEIAKSFLVGKIANSRTVLLRAARETESKENSEALSSASAELAGILNSFRILPSLGTLRGMEGEAARIYFSVFDRLILIQKDEFFFKERNRRPPLDKMNALLSFLYTLLVHDASSALEGVGLDPSVGFLHCDRPGRPSLALDMMEEFRPFVADRLALSLINRQQIKGQGFEVTETGAIMMDEKTRKEVLVAYQKRKQEEILHPFLGEKVFLGILPHCQAMLLARFLRGDLDAYPPFMWK
jgi:CRISPR-associated protein Cas1